MARAVTLTAIYEPVEDGWVQAHLKELLEVITAAPSRSEVKELLHDALSEYLASLDSPPVVGRHRVDGRIRIVASKEGARASSKNGRSGRYSRRSTQSRGRASMSKANDSDRYVQPNKERGGWDIIKEGHERASAHEGTKGEAINRAREIVRNQGGGEIRIKNRRGKLIDSDTVRGPRHHESRARDRK